MKFLFGNVKFSNKNGHYYDITIYSRYLHRQLRAQLPSHHLHKNPALEIWSTTHKRMLHVTHENKNLLKGCLFLIPYKLYRYIIYISHGCCTQPFQSQLKGPSMKFVRIYLCPGRKAVNIIYFGILKQQGPHCGT